MASNLPPGVSGGVSPMIIDNECADGHKWQTEGYFELGATYYVDEEFGMFCPVPGCHQPDKTLGWGEVEHLTPEEQAHVVALYEQQDDGVYMTKTLIKRIEDEQAMDAM